MKKRIAFLFLLISIFSFAGNKYTIEKLNFKEKNNLFYKEKISEKNLLNEKVEIYSQENLEKLIFKINFNYGKIVEIIFSNENTYFEPVNKEETINFELKRIRGKSFMGNLKYVKKKQTEIKKDEKTENSMTSFFSSSLASSIMNYSGDFNEKEVEKFFEKFIKENNDKKIIIRKSDIEGLMTQK